MRLGFLLFACFAPLMAQTLQLYNTANGALDDETYGADFVIGDTFSVQIQGAASMADVTMLAWENGNSVTPTPYLWGQTDNMGNFTLPGTETSSSIGEWMEQWFVGGVQVGNTLDFEVIDKPSWIFVDDVSVAALSSSCPGTIGIEVDILYTIEGQATNQSVITAIPMTPYEDVNFYGDGRVFIGSSSSNIGPVSGYADSSQYADPDTGSFHDVPVGTCANFPFNDAGADQTIYIYIGNNAYQVRAQSFYTSGTGAGHGAITNDNDVTAQR